MQYARVDHQQKVVEDILEQWITLSQNGKFHAILATSSIKEAIEYYRLIKTQSDLNITSLFDPNIDNDGGAHNKEAGLLEIVDDYNHKFGQDFTFATHAKFKKDISARLGHKNLMRKLPRTLSNKLTC